MAIQFTQKEHQERRCTMCNCYYKKNVYANWEQYNKSLFCSNKCRGESYKKNKQGELNPNWKGGAKRCVNCSNFLAQRYANRNSIYCGKCKSLAITGSKHPLWRGDQRSSSLRQRHSKEYKLWRESVYKRDNYTCVSCGDNRGGNLEADHIKPFALYPDLRFDINNGRTLCKECHRKTDTWGYKTLLLANQIL